jgi:hypothetical protein
VQKNTGQNADDHCWLFDYLYQRLQRLQQPELNPPRKLLNSAEARASSALAVSED